MSGLLRPLTIGRFVLPNNLVLAPMAGVTDLPWRNLCREWGAGYAVGEMLHSRSDLMGRDKSQFRGVQQQEQAPIAIQLLGNNPQDMAEAAKAQVAAGADIIDINMGCPAKKVCAVAAGSALLDNERLVAQILAAVVQAVPTTPVTLKIRTGTQRSQKNAEQIARIAENEGIQLLSVHGRTREDKFAGSAEYETIAEVVQSVSIPVLANGDIDT
ncbi:MAG: tRNA dihydrouridine synthase DusB, partial [Thiotrichales bacterium 35-46-9]